MTPAALPVSDGVSDTVPMLVMQDFRLARSLNCNVPACWTTVLYEAPPRTAGPLRRVTAQLLELGWQSSGDMVLCPAHHDSW